ncbi:DDE-type integrase/transposase/recombinase [Kineococcus sp. T13]|uniref:DDE-type integrase/transposase/recombinase n=1 Tax=Kineococcus vitellinus TaxID=2696565 RepID=UPI001411E1B4|nr:DDE-type integrase/transposase/recombinase [Kineococcus vitellinus]
MAVIDVQELGVISIPRRRGCRQVAAGACTAAATRHGRGDTARPRALGYGYLHTILDVETLPARGGHSHLVYTKILSDDEDLTTAAFWARAHDWFTDCGIRLDRCLSDNGSNYRSRDFAAALAVTGAAHQRTRPSRAQTYGPQTHGKVDRSQCRLATEWAHARSCSSEAARRRDMPELLHV